MDAQKPGGAGAVGGIVRLVGRNFAVCLVLALCLIYAVQLGAFQPKIRYAENTAVVGFLENGTKHERQDYAYALENRVVLPFNGNGASESSAIFGGEGDVQSISLFAMKNYTIVSVEIGGSPVCSPCKTGKKYLLPAPVAGKIWIRAAIDAPPQDSGAHLGNRTSFFRERFDTEMAPGIEIVMDGGWRAMHSREMPESVYFIDAPYHLNRIGVVAEYLRNGVWPEEAYGIFSNLPPALLIALFGADRHFAYRVYSIALFFVPILLFYLFSRKLPKHRDSSFLFAALLYLYLPASGLPVGGGADLFMLGMTAHTLATYASLFFIYFAAEYLFEDKRSGFLIAAAAFAFAFASNPRIALTLAAMCATLCIFGLWARADWRKLVVLGAACAAASAWIVVPYLQTLDVVHGEAGEGLLAIKGYGPLEGVKYLGYADALSSFVVACYLLPPVLVAVGAYSAWKMRNRNTAVLFVSAVAVFAIAISPEINRAFPAVDGFRHLPSFFLPAFFVAGIGAAAAWSWIGKGLRLVWEAHFQEIAWNDFVACFAFAALLPACAAFFVVMGSTTEQYSMQAMKPFLARDYASLERAYLAIEGQRAAYIGENSASQYPVFEGNLTRTVVIGFEHPDALVDMLHKARIGYVILGNYKRGYADAHGKSRWEEHRSLADDSRFTQILQNGTAFVFKLDARVGNGLDFYGEGVLFENASVKLDRALFSGKCAKEEGCGILFFSDLPKNTECRVNGMACTALKDAASGGWLVESVPSGEFELSVRPKWPDYEIPLVGLCAATLALCAALGRKL